MPPSTRETRVLPRFERLFSGVLEMFRVREIKEAGWRTFSEVYLMPRRQLYVQRPNGSDDGEVEETGEYNASIWIRDTTRARRPVRGG